MNIKDIIIVLLIVVLLVISGFYLMRLVQIVNNEPLGATLGTYQVNPIVFLNSLTAGCAKIYQKGATTNASTTYYLMASTTIGGASEGFGFPTFATSTKPTNCP